MAQVKKAYQEIVDFLEANKDVKVNKIFDRVVEMAAAKSSRSATGSTYITDKDGNPVAILCYYFKRWMPLVGEAAVEFGAKKSTATGLNTMCKEGVSNWTKQQRQSESELKGLLTRVASGELAAEDISSEQERIEAERKAIAETDLGFATKEEVEAYLADNSVELAEAA